MKMVVFGDMNARVGNVELGRVIAKFGFLQQTGQVKE
jgi:hypothetical protein